MDKIISKLSLQDLTKDTDQDHIDRAYRDTRKIVPVSITQGGKEIDKSNLNKKLEVTLKFKVQSASGKEYVTSVRFQDNLTTLSPVKVSCQCSDFKYRLAKVLHSYNALYDPSTFEADVFKKGEGKTNPQSKHYMCKHLAATMMGLQNEGFIG